MRPLFLVAVLLSGNLLATSNDLLRTAESLRRAVCDKPAVGAKFDISVRALADKSNSRANLPCDDESGKTLLYLESPSLMDMVIRRGDRLHATGTIDVGKRSKMPYANCSSVEILGHGASPAPLDVSVRELLDGKHDFSLVRIKGLVRDVSRDEIDPGYVYLTLVSDETIFYVPFKPVGRAEHDRLNKLIGADVALIGNCIPSDLSARKKIGRIFRPADRLAAVQVLRTVEDAIRTAPDISTLSLVSPQKIALLGLHRARGRVVAKWGRTNLLVKRPGVGYTGMTLSSDSAPAYGDTIEAVGFPESDLYRINLSCATWTPSAPDASCDETPRDTTVSNFLTDMRGRHCFDPYAHGTVLRLRGEVISLSRVGNDDGRLLLKNGEYLVPIDFSACTTALHGLAVGCSIQVTGTCIMESDNWRASAAFPRIRGFALVIRTPADVRVLARPPWWTPGRLAVVIGFLLAALAAILFWNASLRRIAERRGRQLFRSQIAQTTASLKVEERTRLAVELHDAISQTLTGASMRIDAARKLLEHDRGKTARQLAIASTTLDSCREELKNCIWDLRNEALDERDLNEAIRRTLARGIGEAKLSVRFNIPRARLSDNTTNTILCVIRELAVNAVRHGRATKLRIAGSIEDACLLFSVRDNGSGFNPDEAPGVAQGHFGLQGIRERLKRLNGSLVFSRPPEGGTKAVVRIRNTFVHEEKKSS